MYSCHFRFSVHWATTYKDCFKFSEYMRVPLNFAVFSFWKFLDCSIKSRMARNAEWSLQLILKTIKTLPSNDFIQITYTHTYTLTHAHAWIQSQIDTRTCTHTHVYMCVRSLVHTQTHCIHTGVRAHLFKVSQTALHVYTLYEFRLMCFPLPPSTTSSKCIPVLYSKSN